jgi:hypothetical protein
MAERLRVSSSTAAVIASGGSAGESRERRAQPGRQHDLALGLAAERAASAEDLFQRRHRLPTECGEEPYGGLLDQLIFGVGVSQHVMGFQQPSYAAL